MDLEIDISEAQNRCWISHGSFQDHLWQSFLCFRTEAEKYVENMSDWGVVLVVWRPGARPWKHHGISIEDHRGNIDSATTRALYRYTGLSESAALQSRRTESSRPLTR